MVKNRCFITVSIGSIILSLMVVGACESPKRSEVKALKAKIRRVIEDAWNKGNVDALDECL